MKHEIILYGYEIPDNLRHKLDPQYEEIAGESAVPIEDRELRITVESTERDPAKVKTMLLEKLRL